MNKEKSAPALYAEREKRLLDAIELREPDRLPAILFSHFWVARYCGMTCREAMYDYVGLGKRIPRWSRAENCARCRKRVRCPHRRQPAEEVAE